MVRAFAGMCLLTAVVVVVGGDLVNGQQAKNQMVKGTIKTVDPSKDLLIIKQQVKKETVDRELSILDTTEFIVMGGKQKQEVVGKNGLRLLEGKEGAAVAVKCDKDVNVLRVTVTLKK